MYEAALSAGICSAGGNVVLTGVMPTPAVAYLARKHKADAGIVISASHNPFHDNVLNSLVAMVINYQML